MHGRIANLPADQVHWEASWEHDEYILRVSGKVREVSTLGENIALTRKIETRMGGNEILLEDTVENEAPSASPLMILYHTNFGFPLINQCTRLEIPSRRAEDAFNGTSVEPSIYGVCEGPIRTTGNQIYYHYTR